jgi:putative transposase
MPELGLRGAPQGRNVRTTAPNAAAARPPDRVNRAFAPRAPNQLWVADFSYVPTCSGMVSVAFVIDAYARRILGWRVATSRATALVLDALEQAVWTRRRTTTAPASCRTDPPQRRRRPAQYTSIAFTERLAEAGIDASVGSVGDAYDNALAESVIGLYKTELIKPRGPWHTVDEAEAATLHYVHWFNHDRLLEANGDLPPVELEQTYYRRHNTDLAEAG